MDKNTELSMQFLTNINSMDIQDDSWGEPLTVLYCVLIISNLLFPDVRVAQWCNT